MMRTSQNGWPVHDDTSELVRFTAGGRGWWAANDDVAVVAGELIERYAAEVEPIHIGRLDDWSWAKRPIAGSRIFSNHASATAWDINALKHPRHATGTFSPRQLEAGERIRREISDGSGRSVLRWGEQFISAPIDGMHWEISGDRWRVNQAAVKIRAARRAMGLVDMKWDDEIALTAKDAEVWGKKADGTPYQRGDKVTVGQMLRHPTRARMIDQKLDLVLAQIKIPPASGD